MMDDYGPDVDEQPDALLESLLRKLGYGGLDQRLGIQGNEMLSIGLLSLEQRGENFARQERYKYYPKTIGLVRTWRNPPGYQ